MPGTIRSMYLEHMLRDVQTDRGSLLHGRLLRWQFRHRHLGTKMPSGGVHPITHCGRLPTGYGSTAVDPKLPFAGASKTGGTPTLRGRLRSHTGKGFGEPR